MGEDCKLNLWFEGSVSHNMLTMIHVDFVMLMIPSMIHSKMLFLQLILPEDPPHVLTTCPHKSIHCQLPR
eukprot:g73093.t1